MVGSYLFVLRRRLGFILCVTAVLAPLLFLLLESRPERYASQAVIEVGTGTVAEQVIGQPSAYEEPERRVSTQADAVTSRPVAELAAERLGLDVDEAGTLDELVSRISAQPRPATDFIDVTGTGFSPGSAQQVTEAFTSAYLDYRRSLQQAELERLERDLVTQRRDAERALAALPEGEAANREREVLQARIDNAVRIAEAVRLRMSIDPIGVELLSEPTTPVAPANALPPVVTAAAAVLGAALVGIALAFAIDLVRDGVRTRREAEQVAEAPVVATVEQVRHGSGRRAHPASDARALRLGLAAACGRVMPSRTMVIAVAQESDDARDIAALLAQSWCDGTGRVVVFADTTGDAMPPAALTPAAGGATLTLAGHLVVQESELPDVWIGAATDAGPHAALFDVAAPEEVLEDADRHFDAVLVVTDPSTRVEVHTVQHLFQALVLVCRLGRTPSRRVRALTERLRHGHRMLDGVVLTTTPSRLPSRNRRTDAGSPVVARASDRSAAHPAPALSAPSQLRSGNA